MKRTYPTNIDGRIFYIDEDAYALLRSYLDQLHQTFKGCEGNEIVSDIESRIRELFDERMNAGADVITITDVNNVIETMGRPEDLEGNDENMDDNGTEASQSHRPPFFSINLPAHKRLYRNMKNKVFGGVIGGLAVYLGWQPNIMRLVTIIVTIMLAPLVTFWLFPCIYMIAWMVIPAAVTPAQILEMNGTPRNVDTLGQAVIASQAAPPPSTEDNASFLSTFFSIVGKTIMAVFGIFAIFVCLISLAALVAVVAGVLAKAFYLDSTILDNLKMGHLAISKIYAIISGLLLSSLVTGAIGYGASSVLFHMKSFSKSAIITIVIVGLVLFVVTAVFGILAFAA